MNQKAGDQKHNYRCVGLVTYWVTKGVSFIMQSVHSKSKATPYNNLLSTQLCKLFPWQGSTPTIKIMDSVAFSTRGLPIMHIFT